MLYVAYILYGFLSVRNCLRDHVEQDSFFIRVCKIGYESLNPAKFIRFISRHADLIVPLHLS